jgi:hypothetical protein
VACHQFDICYYFAFLHRDADREGASHIPAARILCKGYCRERIEVFEIRFWMDMNDAGENVSVVTPERLFGTLQVPAEQYPWYIDLLRNEKPVWARVFDEPALNALTTLTEPVGEGET